MPVFVAAAIRQIIIWGIQYGLWSAIEKWIMPLFEKAVIEVMEFFGVGEEDARDIMANEFVQAGEFILGNILVWRSKIPVKVAEALRFTSKGFGKRPLSSKAAKATGKLKEVKTATRAIATGDVNKLAQLTATNRGLGWVKIAALLFVVSQVIELPTRIFYMLAQYIDYANWEGYYAGFFRGVFAKLGMPVKADWRKPKTLSKEVFDKVFNTYKLSGAYSIIDPYKGQSLPFTRDNFLDLVDRVAADLLLDTGSAGAKDVLAATTLLLRVDRSKGPGAPAVLTANPATQTYTTPTQAVIPQIKVFTGVVTQGVLADNTPVLAREDDLIENLTELELGAVSNLVPFIKALPGRVAYEIKIVTSVTDKQGFRREGQKQQIVVGYYKNGNPKYKTITNKWAVMNLYAFGSRGQKTKLDTIILGPINAATFNPSQGDMTAMEGRLKDNILAKSFADVTVMRSDYPLTVLSNAAPLAQPAELVIAVAKEATAQTIQQTPEPMPMTAATAGSQSTAAPPPAEEWLEFLFLPSRYMYRVTKEKAAKDIFGVRNELRDLINQGLATLENGNYVLKALGTPFEITPDMVGVPTPAQPAAAAGPSEPALGEYVPSPAFLQYYTDSEIIKRPDGKIYLKPGVPIRWTQIAATTPVQVSVATPAVQAAAAPAPSGLVRIDSSSNPDPLSATTLTGYFGREIALAKRAEWYELFGLGSRALYVGTAEQNVKLLAAIKRQEGGV